MFYNETLTIYAILKIVSERLFLPKNPPSKAQRRQQRNAFLFDTNIICWLHDTGVNTVDDHDLHFYIFVFTTGIKSSTNVKNRPALAFNHFFLNFGLLKTLVMDFLIDCPYISPYGQSMLDPTMVGVTFKKTILIQPYKE